MASPLPTERVAEIAEVVGPSGHRYRVHPTKGFQRRAVNEIRWHETRRCLAIDAGVVATLLRPTLSDLGGLLIPPSEEP